MPLYKNDNGTLLEAPNFVLNKDYELYVEMKDTYTYPVDGWYYYTERSEALAAFGITEEKDENPRTAP